MAVKASESSTNSVAPDEATAQATPDSYLAGYALQQAESAGQALEYTNPLVRKDHSVGISDWSAFEALLRYALFTALALPTRPLGYHFMFLFPASLSLDEKELLTQLLFEKLHLSAVMMFDRPTAVLYASGLISGLVIDVFPKSTELSLIADNDTLLQLSNPLGEDDCDAWLAHLLLRANPSLPALLNPSSPLAEHSDALHSALRRLIQVLKRSNAIAFASDLVTVQRPSKQEQPPPDLDSAQAPPTQAPQEEGSNDMTEAIMSGNVDKLINKKKPTAANGETAPDGDAEQSGPDAGIFHAPHPLNTSLPPIPVGPERHRWAEPLFDPTLLLQCGRAPSDLHQKLSLVQSVQNAVQGLSAVAPLRQAGSVWQHVVMANYAARVPDLGLAVGAALSDVLVDRSRHPSDPNRSLPTFVKMPDYFSEFKHRPDWFSYLGGCILAKVRRPFTPCSLFFCSFSSKPFHRLNSSSLVTTCRRRRFMRVSCELDQSIALMLTRNLTHRPRWTTTKWDLRW